MHIYIPDTQPQIEAANIRNLIMADIYLGLLCDKVNEYDYDMRDLIEKRELVKDELQKKMKAENRRKLRVLEARREALLPDDILLENVDDEIKELKKKLS